MEENQFENLRSQLLEEECNKNSTSNHQTIIVRLTASEDVERIERISIASEI
jgi:hypothetical protein